MVVAAVTFMTLLTLSSINLLNKAATGLKHVDFSKHSGVTEYTETHAETDWPRHHTWTDISVTHRQRVQPTNVRLSVQTII
jgi:hypothetical protein